MQTIITSLETTAGFLERRKFSFAPGLNCIIGARGTCKSTIVETLRFAFPQDTQRDDHIRGSTYPNSQSQLEFPGGAIIAATLSPGSVRVGLLYDSSEITIERDTVPTGTLRAFKDGNVPWSSPGELIQQPEIYSQGELYLIAKDPTLRLALVDRPKIKEIRQLNKQREALAIRVSELGKEIREHRLEINKRKSATSQLSQLHAALAELQRDRPKEADELELEHNSYLIRERLRERTESAVNEVLSRTRKALDTLRSMPEYDSLSLELHALELDPATKIAILLNDAASLKRTLTDELLKFEERASEIENLKASFQTASARYFELLQQARERQEILKKEAAYREEISKFELMAAEARHFEENMAILQAERDDKRTQINAIQSNIYELRAAEVDRINVAFHDRILLTLRPPTDLPQYRAQVRTLLTGSNLRDQDGLAAQIAQTLLPQQLIRIIEHQDASHLADLLDRDLSQMNRLLGHLADNVDVFAIETYVSDDVLDITLYDHGKPKGMDELSKGQMATALLPLILRHSEGPLIIDQPEDDLDNSFIYETLVQQIQMLKHNRQMIFVTHNANIPVLGEADAVIVMDMDSPTKTAEPEVGSVDERREDILRLLEGGQEAFDARAVRYGARGRRSVE